MTRREILFLTGGVTLGFQFPGTLSAQDDDGDDENPFPPPPEPNPPPDDPNEPEPEPPDEPPPEEEPVPTQPAPETPPFSSDPNLGQGTASVPTDPEDQMLGLSEERILGDPGSSLAATHGSWDVFFFGSLEGESPGPLRVGAEGVGLLGYDSKGGFYGGDIAAGGFQVGTLENYYGHYYGEETNSLSGNTGVTLNYVNIGPEIPGIAGVGVGYGTFDTDSGEHGSFVYIGVEAFGVGGSIGFGWSVEAPHLNPNDMICKIK